MYSTCIFATKYIGNVTWIEYSSYLVDAHNTRAQVGQMQHTAKDEATKTRVIREFGVKTLECAL